MATCSFPFSFDPFHALRFDSIWFGAEFQFGMLQFYLFMLNTQRPSMNVWNLRSAEDKYDMLHIFWHDSLSPYNPHITRIHLHLHPPFHTLTHAPLPYLYWFISICGTAHSSSPFLMCVVLIILLQNVLLFKSNQYHHTINQYIKSFNFMT